MKKMCILIAVILIFSMSTTAFAEHWADVPYKYMTDNGYISEGDPNAYMTRLEVAQAIAKLPLIDKNSNYIFTDTSNKDIVKVAKAGLMHGVGNQLFVPDSNITRAEIAKTVALLIASPQSYEELPFTDRDEIADWAKPFVTALFRDEIVLGYGDNTFRPGNHITRAEFSVLFMKIRDIYSLGTITNNVANNALVQDVQYLSIPNGYVGVISLPSIGLNNLPVVENGDDLDNIKDVAGHFINTALFDGNVGLLGHNFTDKSPWFGKLADIKIGDTIIWKTKFGFRYYSVTVNKNINAEDWSGLMETGNNQITIITCLKGQADTTRIMVQAVESAP